MEYAYVFDYTIPSIFEIEITPELDGLDTESFLNKVGLNIDSCYVMFTQEKLEIEKLTPNI